MKRLLLTILVVSTIWSSARAALVVFGDTTGGGTPVALGRAVTYPRWGGTMGGSGTITMDSIIFWAHDNSDGLDTVRVCFYDDAGGVSPNVRKSVDTIIVSGGTLTRYKKTPAATITATAGSIYWFALQEPLGNTSAVYKVGLNTTSHASAAYKSYPIEIPNPWGTYTDGGSLATFQLAYYGHDSGGGGSPAPSSKNVLIRKLSQLLAPNWDWWWC